MTKLQRTKNGKPQTQTEIFGNNTSTKPKAAHPTKQEQNAKTQDKNMIS
jgi:hypothetical protein